MHTAVRAYSYLYPSCFSRWIVDCRCIKSRRSRIACAELSRRTTGKTESALVTFFIMENTYQLVFLYHFTQLHLCFGCRSGWSRVLADRVIGGDRRRILLLVQHNVQICCVWGQSDTRFSQIRGTERWGLPSTFNLLQCFGESLNVRFRQLPREAISFSFDSMPVPITTLWRLLRR